MVFGSVLRDLARWAGAALGGAITALALAPSGHGWTAPAGVAVLALTLIGVNRRQCALLGWLHGCTFLLLHLAWLASSVHPVAWFALSVAVGAWSALVALAMRAAWHWRGGFVLGAGAWVGVEQVRSEWPLGGMPWGQLGFSAVDTPWQGALSIVGVPGVGFLVAVVGCALARVVAWGTARASATPHSALHPAPPSISPGRGAAVIVCASALAGLAAAAATSAAWTIPSGAPTGQTPPRTMTVAIVQGGVPGDGTVIAPYHREVTLSHARLTRQVAEAAARGDLPELDLVLWPENATSVDPRSDAVLDAAVRGAAARADAPILVGSMMDGPTSELMANQAVVWSASGPTGQSYTKRHPVPFGEYLPARDLVETLRGPVGRLPRDAVKGSADPTPLNLAGVTVAVAICFDIAYGDTVRNQVRNGAGLIVVQTSNVTFFGTGQPEQQLMITRARAVEAGRAVVVASPNGASAFVDPTGAVTTRLPSGLPAVAVEDVPLRWNLTPAARGGSAASRAAALTTLASIPAATLLIGLARRRSSRGRKTRVVRDEGAAGTA